MKYTDAKTILSSYWSCGEWFGTNYNLNLYRGCCHGCIYCDSRSECYHVEDFDTVKAKRNAVAILESELCKRRKRGVVGFGAMSDPYNPFERKEQLTRNALILLDKYRFGASMITKSDMLTRDIDIYKSIAKHSPVIVKFTITTPKDEKSKVIEPYASSSSERFAALNECARNGLYTGVLMSPVLPFVTDGIDDICEMVRMSKDNGADFIFTYYGMTLRGNQRDYYYDRLNEYAPHLVPKYIREYGESYSCYIPDIKSVSEAFVNACEKLGITYKMEDIIDGYQKNYRVEQMSFL